MKYLLVFLGMTLSGCSGVVKALSDWSIEKRCIEGHIYYFNHGVYAGGIAPKLTDDGKPCECRNEIDLNLGGGEIK